MVRKANVLGNAEKMNAEKQKVWLKTDQELYKIEDIFDEIEWELDKVWVKWRCKHGG